jgi:predicted transcriptional regulator
LDYQVFMFALHRDEMVSVRSCASNGGGILASLSLNLISLIAPSSAGLAVG